MQAARRARASLRLHTGMAPARLNGVAAPALTRPSRSLADQILPREGDRQRQRRWRIALSGAAGLVSYLHVQSDGGRGHVDAEG